MFNFLLFIILAVILFVLFLGIFIFMGLKNLLFGKNNKQQPYAQDNPYRQHQQSKEEEKRGEDPHVKISRKLFEAEKGEYVDYEEIAEEK